MSLFYNQFKFSLVFDNDVCSFNQWRKTYGSVMTVHLGPQRMVVLVGYETVKEALVDQAEDFAPRAPIAFMNRIVKGYGEGFVYLLCLKNINYQFNVS